MDVNTFHSFTQLMPLEAWKAKNLRTRVHDRSSIPWERTVTGQRRSSRTTEEDQDRSLSDASDQRRLRTKLYGERKIMAGRRYRRLRLEFVVCSYCGFDSETTSGSSDLWPHALNYMLYLIGDLSHSRRNWIAVSLFFPSDAQIGVTYLCQLLDN